MSRHARTPDDPGDAPPGRRSRRGRGGRGSLIAAALAGTLLAAGAGGVLSGVLPLSSAVPAELASAARISTLASVSGKPADRQLSGAQQQILALVNAQRLRHGCGTLHASASLNQLAQSYSTEMGTEDFFSHTDPAGRTPWDRARAVGIANLGGENIAMGQQSPQSVMSAWMNSPGHRANILDCDYHSLGVGVFYGYGSGSGPWWTEDFGF
jgi:uncharacterized protein YkwD